MATRLQPLRWYGLKISRDQKAIKEGNMKDALSNDRQRRRLKKRAAEFTSCRHDMMASARLPRRPGKHDVDHQRNNHDSE